MAASELVEAHAAGVHPHPTAAVGPALVAIGTLTLCRLGCVLAGPRGELRLTKPLYLLTECLMRCPGALVTTSDLIAAMHPDANRAPKRADAMLRKHIKQLRGAILMLTHNGVRVRAELDTGYAIEVRR